MDEKCSELVVKIVSQFFSDTFSENHNGLKDKDKE